MPKIIISFFTNAIVSFAIIETPPRWILIFLSSNWSIIVLTVKILFSLSLSCFFFSISYLKSNWDKSLSSASFFLFNSLSLILSSTIALKLRFFFRLISKPVVVASSLIIKFLKIGLLSNSISASTIFTCVI